jgi:hypothetical protein
MVTADFVIILGHSKWKSFVKKLITASFLLLTLVACSNVAQLTPTAVPTFEPLPSVIPTETLQALSSLPSTTPAAETITTAMPDPGDVLDPRGIPVREWRGIPIMPEAITGQEFGNNNAYSFKTNATAKEVQDFYTERLAELGWSQPLNSPFDANGGTMTFRKAGSSLAVTVASSEDSFVVLLVMTLA